MIMAHLQQFRFINFVKEVLPEYFHDKKILEIGSLNINGSVRNFFTECDYLGVDVSVGKDVDVVSNGEDFNGKASSFDVVISCECMEHNPSYEKTFLNMIRLVSPNGLVVMTCATYGRPQHGTIESEPASSPLTLNLGQNYYKNLIQEDFNIIAFDRFFCDYFFVTDYSGNDLYFVGLGRDALLDSKEKFMSMKSVCIEFYEALAKLGLR